jgi:hypothetical protein
MKHHLISYGGCTLEEQLRGVRPMLCHHLFSLAWPVVKQFRGDLYHDALWVEKYINVDEVGNGPVMHFYYGVREYGTAIGTNPEYIIRFGNDLLYKVTLINTNNGMWDAEICEIPATKEVMAVPTPG